MSDAVDDVAYVGEASAPWTCTIRPAERGGNNWTKVSTIPSYRAADGAKKELRGYLIGDEMGGGHTGAIKAGAMTRVEETRRNNVRIPFLVTWTSADQVALQTKIRNAESVRHTAVRELNLTGAQLVVGCMCFLGADRHV
jgi:hypothetical protein